MTASLNGKPTSRRVVVIGGGFAGRATVRALRGRGLLLIRRTSSFLTRNRGARLITGEVRSAGREADGPSEDASTNR